MWEFVYFYVLLQFHASSLFWNGYLGSQFGIMQPLASLSATPSRNLGCGFKSMILQLSNSISREECTPKKHSSFQIAYIDLIPASYVPPMCFALVSKATKHIKLIVMKLCANISSKVSILCMCLELGVYPCMKSTVLALQRSTLYYSLLSHATLILCYQAFVLTLQASFISRALWVANGVI